MNTQIGALRLWQWLMILGSIGVTYGLIWGRRAR